MPPAIILKTKRNTATLNISQSGKAATRTSRKTIQGVDLTAMVDLAFLLITFFMLTTSLGKMNVMDIAKPVPIQKPIDLAVWPASKTLTILLGKNSQLAYYMGEAKVASLDVSSFKDIRKVILDKREAVAKAHEKDLNRDMYVSVKPTSLSVYRNFVDILDEMNIIKIGTYAIGDKYMLAEETSFMRSKKI